MTSPALILQKAIRNRLIGSADLTAIVPATQVFDSSSKPTVFPCIIIGEAQEIEDNFLLDGSTYEVFQTLHIWTREQGLVNVKRISGLARRAIKSGKFSLPLTDEFQACDVRFRDARYMRDPDGETAHGVFTIRSLLQESWSFTL